MQKKKKSVIISILYKKLYSTYINITLYLCNLTNWLNYIFNFI